ncbi:MAG: DUF4202 domain-containing protein [Flavobacteriaceae bacterium]
MNSSERVAKAFEHFDKANSNDPNSENHNGQEYAKEVLYAIRMTDTLTNFAPTAPETLQLTARCQHICRWQIPRDSYPMNRVGYLQWRQDLKKFHVKKASEILSEVGYGEDVIAKVGFLLEKKQLKKNKDTQTLEDVICLVFLEHYFEAFAQKHAEDKIIVVLQKTWRKMSKKGQEAALSLPLSKSTLALVTKAVLG